jgi:hypothetical protein
MSAGWKTLDTVNQSKDEDLDGHNRGPKYVIYWAEAVTRRRRRRRRRRLNVELGDLYRAPCVVG